MQLGSSSGNLSMIIQMLAHNTSDLQFIGSNPGVHCACVLFHLGVSLQQYVSGLSSTKTEESNWTFYDLNTFSLFSGHVHT